MSNNLQKRIDDFYKNNGGACCAGCDWWRYINSVVGECTKTAPVSGVDRIGILSIESSSIKPDSGHVMTRRNHSCGDFVDTFDWDLLAGFLSMRNQMGGPARVTKEKSDGEAPGNGGATFSGSHPDRSPRISTDKLLGKDK